MLSQDEKERIIALKLLLYSFLTLLFAFIAWTQQVLPHQWSLSELAGRKTIVLTGYEFKTGLHSADMNTAVDSRAAIATP
jgi:hypothetical protein